MFKSFRNKGFQLRFDNGYTVSVAFGYCNYCDAQDYDKKWNAWRTEDDVHKSQTAEVAIIHPNGDFVDLHGNRSDVFGWRTTNDVAGIIAAVALFRKAN